MKIKYAVVVIGATLLIRAVPASAHHSFATQYDATKPIQATGVVTKVEWTNPHARVYIDVPNEKGGVSNWNFEMASPNVLVRNGWKRTTLKIGDRITIAGYLARTGPPMAIAGTMTGPDGQKLFASNTSDTAN
jgi:Family of unknown function (DUF6152)